MEVCIFLNYVNQIKIKLKFHLLGFNTTPILRSKPICSTEFYFSNFTIYLKGNNIGTNTHRKREREDIQGERQFRERDNYKEIFHLLIH